MKPFNLEEALSGKPVVTRDGRPVKIAGYNPEAFNEAQVIGWAAKDYRGWTAIGEYVEGEDHPADLFMAPEKREWWVNLYKAADGRAHVSGSYSSENAAKEGMIAIGATFNYLTTVKVWEEDV